MDKVQLKITPSLASIFDTHSSDWLVFDMEIGKGTTVRDLLADLAFRHPDFRKMVFNPDIGKVSDQVMVFLNDNLLQEPGVTKTNLSDGDSIMFLPMFAGG